MLSLVELRRVAGWLAEHAVGAKLQAVAQPAATALVLELYHQEHGREALLLGCDPRTGRVARAPRARSGGSAPGAAVQWLRAHAVGTTLEGARLRGDDRHLVLAFARREPAEPVAELRLLLMGGRSNLYVLDAEARLRAALRPLSSTRRDLTLGEPWREPEGAPRDAGRDRFAEVEDAALLGAIASAYQERDGEGEREALRRRVGQALRKRLQALDRKQRAIDRDREAAARAPVHRRHGELLKGALHQVRPGADAVTVTDYETGEPVVVPLDPTLDARANLERLFKRHRKAEKTALAAAQRHGEAEAQREEVQALKDAFEATSDEGLAEFAARPEVKRLLARYAPQPVAEAAPRPKGPFHKTPPRLRPRRYPTAGGLEIWVGRNDAGNDHLSVRLARGRDLFLHVEGAPGSHVVLRTGGRDDPPSEALLDAAELAAHFSSQKGAPALDIHVVPIRNVSKPKGAKPGLVHVHGGRTLHLRRDPARLERVLGARIEES